jgi:beta-D-xylosidase 4
VWGGYPGQAGGQALRDILDGTRAPAGRLPVTQYPANYINEVSIFNPGLRPNASVNPGRTYIWYPTPVLPFGYGLHYTDFTFKWGKTPSATYDISTILKGASSIIETTPFVTVTASVTNTGKVTSDYVGLLFISTKDAGPTPYPIKTLVSFDRLGNVTAKNTATLSLPLTLGSLSRAAANGSFIIYPGTYTLTLDNEPSLSFTFKLTGKETLIESVPIPVTPAPPSIEPLGCFQDSLNRTLNGPVTTTATNTVQECATTCNAAGFLYAGVESARECWCSNTLSNSSAPVVQTSCNLACTGDSDELCGGASFIDVFKITPSVTAQAPVYTGGA